MANTSLGYHTFAFFQKADEETFSVLTRDFITYADKNDDLKRFPMDNHKGWEYVYKKNKGIRWLLISSSMKNGFMIQGVMAVINPRALIESNYISAARENDLEIVEKLFNEEAAKISSVLLPFGSCSLNRADSCLNIDLEELGFPCTPEQMMKLIKRGNIPKHYKEREERYDPKQHRKVADPYSFYLKSNSCVINYYWKYPQQDENHPNFRDREASRSVIRLEVQCKYPKLYALSRNTRCESSRFYVSAQDLSSEELFQRLEDNISNPLIPIDTMLSDEVSESIVRKYFYKIIRKGDYFTLDIAKDIVESHNFRRDKEARIIYALEMVSKYRGISKTKSKLYSVDLSDFKRSLKDLDDILVNPVTIPRKWKIEHIPNLFRAYDNAVYEEQLIPCSEYMALKHIDEVLAERSQRF